MDIVEDFVQVLPCYNSVNGENQAKILGLENP
jgi:hypothetical protein